MVKTYKKGAKKKLSENFNQSEFDCKSKKCCTQTLIDSELVSLLQKIRDHFGCAVTINSAYRCQKHNLAVGGVKNSLHCQGKAADIVVKGISPLKVAAYAEHIGVKGIGQYDGFTHVDTRAVKSFWYSSKQSYRSTFGGKNPYVEPVENCVYGSTGEKVKWCQWELNFAGFNCGTVDGVAGEKFVKAVKKFQKKKGLDADGIVGKKTRKALKEN